MPIVPTRYVLLLFLLGIAFGFFLLPIFQENTIPTELFAILITFCMLMIAKIQYQYPGSSNILKYGLLVGFGFIMALFLSNILGSV